MRTKTEEKRQAILEVAAAAFGELGFERTSMSEISNRLGGSKATLYNYFPSKEALFVEVMFQASAAEFQSTVQALQAQGESLELAIRTFGRRFLGVLYTSEVTAVRRLLVAECERSGLGARCHEKGPKRSIALISEFLAGAMARGELRKSSPELATRQLLALLEAELFERLIFQHLPLPSREETVVCADRAIDAFLRLYRT